LSSPTAWAGLSGGASGRRNGQSGYHTQSVRPIVLQIDVTSHTAGCFARGGERDGTNRQPAVAGGDAFLLHLSRLEMQVGNPTGKISLHRTQNQR
jgi:hypothetical protein